MAGLFLTHSTPAGLCSLTSLIASWDMKQLKPQKQICSCQAWAIPSEGKIGVTLHPEGTPANRMGKYPHCFPLAVCFITACREMVPRIKVPALEPAHAPTPLHPPTPRPQGLTEQLSLLELLLQDTRYLGILLSLVVFLLDLL